MAGEKSGKNIHLSNGLNYRFNRMSCDFPSTAQSFYKQNELCFPETDTMAEISALRLTSCHFIGARAQKIDDHNKNKENETETEGMLCNYDIIMCKLCRITEYVNINNQVVCVVHNSYVFNAFPQTHVGSDGFSVILLPVYCSSGQNNSCINSVYREQ